MQGIGCRVHGVGCRIPFRARSLELVFAEHHPPTPRFLVPAADVGVEGLVCGVEGLGFRV